MSKIKITLASLLLPALLLPALYGCSTAPTAPTDFTTAPDAPSAQPQDIDGTTDTSEATTIKETTTPDDPTLPPGLQNRPRPEPGLPANAPTPDPFQATLKNNDIYCFNGKVGQLKDGRVHMQLGERTVSFLPPESGFEIGKLSCHVAEWNDSSYKYGNFSYLGLEISTQIHSPYGIYKPIITAEENNRITYKCDSPLVTVDQASGEKPDHQPAFENCQTNGLNLLTQYEFNAASGSPVMVTGGEYGVSWQKIFIKRRGNLNYFFIGDLATSINDYWYYGDDVGQYRKKTSEENLSRLIEHPDNSPRLEAWQDIVKSFNLES